MNTSEKIKTLRIAKGLSQEDLGRLVGVQRAAINKYETGRVVNIKKTTLIKIASVLGVSPAELLDDNDELAIEEPYYIDEEVRVMAQELANRPELQVLFSASRNVSKEDIEAVANILEKMKKD